MRIHLAACAALCLTPSSAVAGVAPPRTNVLLLCADDLRCSSIGLYGGGPAKTPSLDRLAAGGVRFDRAYCNSPVCTASRQSFLTGRYPWTIGVTRLKTALPERETTLAELLASAGYRTAAIGKMHFNSDLAHGFQTRVDMKDHARFQRTKGVALLEGKDLLGPWRPFRDPARVWLNSSALPYPAKASDMAASFFVRAAEDFLAAKDDRPFFLMVSFYEPHSPFHFPVEYRGRHRAEDQLAPAVAPADVPRIPKVFRDLSEAEKRGIRAAYATSAEFLDANVGAVLDALEKSGRKSETLVVFLSDHGYMLGEHGRFEKHTMYEPAVRAPLVIRPPGFPPRPAVSEALVELVDLVPTVLAYCDVAAPVNLQGASLRLILQGRVTRFRDFAVSAYAESAEGMLREDRFKLIYRAGNREREDGYAEERPLEGRRISLFDLQSDPEEHHDLAESPTHRARVERMTSMLAERIAATARIAPPAGLDPEAILDRWLGPSAEAAALP